MFITTLTLSIFYGVLIDLCDYGIVITDQRSITTKIVLRQRRSHVVSSFSLIFIIQLNTALLQNSFAKRNKYPKSIQTLIFNEIRKTYFQQRFFRANLAAPEIQNRKHFTKIENKNRIRKTESVRNFWTNFNKIYVDQVNRRASGKSDEHENAVDTDEHEDAVNTKSSPVEDACQRKKSCRMNHSRSYRYRKSI